MDRVWVVSYYDKGDPEATVTVFSDKRAATDYYTHILNKHMNLSLDEYPVYNTFVKESYE